MLGVTGVAPAAAHGDGHSGHSGSGHSADGQNTTGRSSGEHGGGAHTGQSSGVAEAAAFGKASGGRAVSFIARLSGENEVPVAGGPAVNDPDGEAVALVKVKGDRVTFALQWQGFVPSLGHIHQGRAGQNGAVKVGLFGTAMPDSAHSAAGQVALTDAELAQEIRSNPAGFYVNLHSAEFPGGAVRGQLKPLKKNINPLSIIKGGKLRALSNGEQEVPKNETSRVGDPDGRAVTFLSPRGTRVDYSLAWINIKSPSLGHIHKGRFGQNGEVVFNFFNRPVPDGVFAVAGRLNGQDAQAVQRVRANPLNYYSNIHTSEFPDGAVRGQLFG
ncbi:CHRD domain-containing protein [Streptomyces sp. NPDC051018]|uniref:CHRD domain-containing protein n=1 Tax=Streptomyces sp. NPDC051018 TaxID=3365639 RepID=UPI00379FBF38